jgi:hypothetical protein
MLQALSFHSKMHAFSKRVLIDNGAPRWGSSTDLSKIDTRDAAREGKALTQLSE